MVKLLSLLFLGSLACAFLLMISQSQTSRFYAYAGYGEAIQYFSGQFGGFPASLTELEEAYNGYERSKTHLPPQGYSRPEFRPIRSTQEGMYLVIIEPKTGCYWTYLKRFVLYASADGSVTRSEFVWRWKIDKLVAEDDSARLRAQKPFPEGLTKCWQPDFSEH